MFIVGFVVLAAYCFYFEYIDYGCYSSIMAFQTIIIKQNGIQEKRSQWIANKIDLILNR